MYEKLIKDVYQAIDSVRTCMAFDSRDWHSNKRDAWLFSILQGYESDDEYDPEGEDCWQDNAEKFDWDAVTLKKLRKMSRALKELEEAAKKLGYYEIHTASFFEDRKIGDQFSIANSVPDDYEVETLKSFVPPWEIVQAFKNDEISWDQFKDRYLKYLKNSDTEKDIKRLKISEGRRCATLMCWERFPNFCHRSILAEWLKDKGFNIGYIR